MWAFAKLSRLSSGVLKSLVGMVAERLLYHVGLNPGIRRVLFEDSPKLAALRAQFAEIAPAYTVGQISQAEWLASGLPADCYLVTHTFGAPGWEKTVDLGPALCRAAMDMAESCRITNQPLCLKFTGASLRPILAQSSRRTCWTSSPSLMISK